MDLGERRELNNAAGDAISKAFELVLTPAIFGVVGFLVDRWLGTFPIFTLSLGLSVFAYQCWRQFTAYDAAMARHEADKPWNRPAAPRPSGEVTDDDG